MKSIGELLNDLPIQKTETNVVEKLNKQAETYNNSEGDMKELDCPICKNKGYIQKVVFNEMYQKHIPVMVRCECMKKRQTLIKARKSGLGEYINKRFNDFTVNSDWQKEIKQKAIDYAKVDDDHWFVTLGQCGSGKTLISCIIANYFLVTKNKEVIYITWTDFISKLKRDIMSDNSAQVSEYLDTIKKVELLYIDELLKKYNETDLKYIIEIINYRYTNNLKTIISSEKTIGELLEIDEATFSRMVEKADKYIINIKKDINKNYRLRNIM